jgi:hypothetical protein
MEKIFIVSSQLDATKAKHSSRRLKYHQVLQRENSLAAKFLSMPVERSGQTRHAKGATVRKQAQDTPFHGQRSAAQAASAVGVPKSLTLPTARLAVQGHP